MIFKWYRIKLGPFCFPIPVLVFIAVQLAEHEVSALRDAKIAACDYCRKSLKLHRANAWGHHLRVMHGFDDNESYDYIASVYRRIHHARTAQGKCHKEIKEKA